MEKRIFFFLSLCYNGFILKKRDDLSMKKRYELDMCHGPLASKILLFALPLMLSSLLQLLFNAVDIVVVGQFCGKTSLAAVGSNTSLINLFINLFVGLSVGANVVAAQDLGAGEHASTNRTLHTSLALAILSGIFLTGVGLLLGRKMLEWMSSPETVVDLATLYLRVYFLGMPATMVYNFGSAMLRAKGDTQRPLYFLLFAGCVNVVLNLCFVMVFHWDVAGVAAATSIAQYISAGLVLWCLHHETDALHLDWKQIRIHPAILVRIIRVGLPAGFQGVVFALSNVVIQSTVNSFGDVVMAGSAASQNIEGFVYIAMNAFYQAAITFVGQNYGAGHCKRVDRVALLCVSFSMLTGLVFGNLVYLFGPSLISVYSPGDPLVIEAGMIRLSCIVCLYAICGWMDTMVGVLRGLGHSMVPMVVSLLGSCALRLLWVALVFPHFGVPAALFISYPITWTITGLCHTIIFFCIRKPAYRLVQRSFLDYAEG